MAQIGCCKQADVAPLANKDAEVFARVASSGPRFVEIGYTQEYVRKLLGTVAKTRTFIAGSRNEELVGQCVDLFRYPDGDVIVLYDKNLSTKLVAIHSNSDKLFEEYNKGGYPTFYLNQPAKEIFHGSINLDDISQLPIAKDYYNNIQDGQVIAFEGMNYASILNVQYWGRGSEYCTFIFRADAISQKLKGFAYYLDLSSKELSWAIWMMLAEGEIR